MTATPSLDPQLLTAAAALVVDAINRDEGWGELKDRVRGLATRDPIDAMLVTVFGSALLFWHAERRENPKVNTFGDALVFVTTCVSVGYSDIFARTPQGKAIASWLMTVGPALAASLFDPPAAEAAREAEVDRGLQRDILARLDAILAALERRDGAR